MKPPGDDTYQDVEYTCLFASKHQSRLLSNNHPIQDVLKGNPPTLNFFPERKAVVPVCEGEQKMSLSSISEGVPLMTLHEFEKSFGLPIHMGKIWITKTIKTRFY